jgi:hypothetical protein
MQIDLPQGVDTGSLDGGWVGIWSAGISKNGQIYAVIEASMASTGIRIGTNPVIGDRLIGVENSGVSLASEDAERINLQWYSVLPIRFDDREIVVVDREIPVRVTGHSDDAEAISSTSPDIYYAEGSGWPSRIPSSSIDQC